MALLNPRREKFCRNVALLKMRGGKAYMSAGFDTKSVEVSGRSAALLMRRVDVQNRIAALLEREIEADMQTRESLVAKHMEIANRCMQKVPVKDGSGKDIGIWKFDSTGGNNALAGAAKLLGLSVEKIAITGIEAEVNGKSQKELLEMVTAAAVDLGRDFIKQLGEKVGLQYRGDGEGDAGATAPTIEPVSTLQ